MGEQLKSTGHGREVGAGHRTAHCSPLVLLAPPPPLRQHSASFSLACLRCLPCLSLPRAAGQLHNRYLAKEKDASGTVRQKYSLDWLLAHPPEEDDPYSPQAGVSGTGQRLRLAGSPLPACCCRLSQGQGVEEGHSLPGLTASASVSHRLT